MSNNQDFEKRGVFASKFGVIAAAAGSAIGLGNIWKFPYEAGQNGGGAFLLVYLLLLLAIGTPIMISEFIIGRHSRRNPVGTFNHLKPKSKWKWVGIMGVIASFLILAFYSTVAGWTLEYIKIAITNQYQNLDAEGLRALFSNFTSNPAMPVFWQSLFMVFTVVIVLAGIEKGIERYTKYLMPLLFILIIILCIQSLTLPNAGKGLSFLFTPDFSKIDSKVFLNALGQVFFSLSLGMGTMITYGSYIQNKVKLTEIAVKVSLTDTLVALLAGIAIFPAVFALGFKPDEGTGLVFVVLPQVFNSLPLGQLFAVSFFILLAIAAVTSSISLLEVVVAYFIEEKRMARRKATILAGAASLLIGIISTVSFADISYLKFGKILFFDVLVYLTSNLMLPLGGLFIVIFVGWVINKQHIYKQLNINEITTKPFWFKSFLLVVKYIAPIAILFVFLNALGIL